MSNVNAPLTKKELLDEYEEVLEDRKNAAKQMSIVISDLAKAQHVEKKTLSLAKSLLFGKGEGWLGGNPLEHDPDAKHTDKFQAPLRKFSEIVFALQAIDCLDWLDPYIEEMDARGIHITIDKGEVEISDKVEVEQALQNAVSFQKTVKALDDKIKEEGAPTAEEIELTKKSAFSHLLKFYADKQNGKDLDDKYQQAIADYTLIETGLTNVYDGNI